MNCNRCTDLVTGLQLPFSFEENYFKSVARTALQCKLDFNEKNTSYGVIHNTQEN